MFVIMALIRIFVCCLLFFVFSGADVKTRTPTTREIINQMLDSVKNLKTQRCSVKATERVGERLLFAEAFIKINYNPKKIYYVNSSKGTEALYVQGTNSGDALVRSRSFPLMNFNLDPYGSMMRKDQHHTLLDLGFQYIGLTLANTILKAPKDFDKHFLYAGSVTYNDRDCHQIIVNYPEYKYIEYTVGKGETVTSIAYKFNTSDFKIRNTNSLSSYFGTLKEGKKLQIPSPYANKAILYIDKKMAMPVCIKVYDEKGLYESYEFFNVIINKPFAENEFTKKFPGYGF